MQTVRKKGKRKYWTGGNEIERKRVRKKEEEFTKGVKKRTGEERGRRRQGVGGRCGRSTRVRSKKRSTRAVHTSLGKHTYAH